MTSDLAIYLQNHEAAAQAGLDLFRRVSRSQRNREYGAELARLRDDVADDLARLRRLMEDLGIRPNRPLGVVLRLAERLGRLKPNGALLSRASLTDLVEIEALTDAVHAKLAGWRALAVADAGDSDTVEDLIRRAEDQADRLWVLHRSVAETLRRR